MDYCGFKFPCAWILVVFFICSVLYFVFCNTDLLIIVLRQQTCVHVYVCVFNITLKIIAWIITKLLHLLDIVVTTVKPVLSDHSKRRPNIVFSDQFSLNAGQKYCRMLPESILQYFRHSLSYYLS